VLPSFYSYLPAHSALGGDMVLIACVRVAALGIGRPEHKWSSEEGAAHEQMGRLGLVVLG
jgi:hypothetical protein